MADFGHFFLLTGGSGGGEEPPTGEGENAPMPPPPWCCHWTNLDLSLGQIETLGVHTPFFFFFCLQLAKITRYALSDDKLRHITIVIIWIKTRFTFLVWTHPKSSQDHPGNPIIIITMPDVGGFSLYFDCGFTFISSTSIPSILKLPSKLLGSYIHYSYTIMLKISLTLSHIRSWNIIQFQMQLAKWSTKGWKVKRNQNLFTSGIEVAEPTRQNTCSNSPFVSFKLLWFLWWGWNIGWLVISSTSPITDYD